MLLTYCKPSRGCFDIYCQACRFRDFMYLVNASNAADCTRAYLLVDSFNTRCFTVFCKGRGAVWKTVVLMISNEAALRATRASVRMSFTVMKPIRCRSLEGSSDVSWSLVRNMRQYKTVTEDAYLPSFSSGRMLSPSRRETPRPPCWTSVAWRALSCP